VPDGYRNALARAKTALKLDENHGKRRRKHSQNAITIENRF